MSYKIFALYFFVLSAWCHGEYNPLKEIMRNDQQSSQQVEYTFEILNSSIHLKKIVTEDGEVISVTYAPAEKITRYYPDEVAKDVYYAPDFKVIAYKKDDGKIVFIENIKKECRSVQDRMARLPGEVGSIDREGLYCKLMLQLPNKTK